MIFALQLIGTGLLGLLGLFASIGAVVGFWHDWIYLDRGDLRDLILTVAIVLLGVLLIACAAAVCPFTISISFR